MVRKHLIRKSTLALAIASAVGISPALVAQEQELEEITVTGTRIRVTDGMAEPTPVTSLTPLELMMFEPGGTIAEQLDALPQFFRTATAQQGAAGLFSDGGGSYLDMRGLGANRTLILLDGSRVPPADKRGQVNVDNFPTALMRSVDVVTGGASAAYGADALGGVTNFVLDREFEGIKFTASTGVNEFNNDGKNYNLSLAGGRQFGDRLNVIGSVETQTTDDIYRAASELDDDWYRRWGTVTNPAWSAADAPGTNPQRITVPWLTTTSNNSAGIIGGFPRGSTFNGMTFTDDGSNIRPFVHGDTYGTATSGGPEVDRALRDGGSINGSGVERRSGFVGLQYAVNENFSVFGQALVGRVESINLAEHTGYQMGSFGPAYYRRIYRENPYLPPALADAMDAAGLSSITLSTAGNPIDQYAVGAGELTHTTFTTQSWQIGFESTLPNGWEVRASWQSGETNKRHDEFPSARIDREALARDAVVDPATGAIVCNVQLSNPSEADLAASPSVVGLFGNNNDEVTPLASPIGLDNSVRDCVPYNAMGTEGMSQEAWNYIHTHKAAETVVEQDFAEVLLTGELYEGWGYGPLSFATGLTYREQSFRDRGYPEAINELGPPLNDEALGIRGIPSAFTAFGAATNLHQFSTVENISGKYDVWEVFGELQVPIWESESGAQALGGNVAYRSSEYSSSGRSESWKLGMEVQVFEDLRLRATRSRDVREASFSERFDRGTTGATLNNPWTGETSIPTVAAVGNPNLRPELADTIVAGVVYQPSWLDGLSMSTDWYEVEITDAIATLGAQAVVDNCFNNNDSCEFVVRNAVQDIVKVFNPQLNLAGAKVEGVDFETSYRIEPDFFGSEVESLSVRAVVGWLGEKSTTSPGGTYSDGVGGYQGFFLFPDYTGNVNLNYSVGPWGMQWQQRFISESKNNVTWTEGVDVDDNSIPFYSWSNVQFSYRTEMDNGGDWSINFNISNLFDKNPGIVSGGNGNQGSGYGDEYGRRFQLSLNMNF
jgi:outer membrane receptor protein involved in Fe transport